MKLWLIRHATVRVPPGTCYGVSEVPADGPATARAAESFAGVPAQGCVLWTSPSGRALQLAQALASRRADLPAPRVDDRLREMDFGQWEMRPWNDIPREALDAWTADFPHHRFGGRESAQAVIDRVARALDETRAMDVPEAVWVTHAGVIRAARFLAACEMHGRRAIALAGEWPSSAPAMGEWISLEV